MALSESQGEQEVGGIENLSQEAAESSTQVVLVKSIGLDSHPLLPLAFV